MIEHNNDIEKWQWLKQELGADKMLEDISHYISNDMIAKLLMWFEKDGYFKNYQKD